MKQKELDKKLERLGFLLKDQRENMFISIKKVSKETGLNRNTIRSLEKGKGQIASFEIYTDYLGMELLVLKSENILSNIKKEG